MICEKCKKQFELDNPPEKVEKFLGLCPKCGRQLTHWRFLTAYTEAFVVSAFSGPIFYAFFIGKEIIYIMMFGLVVTSLPIYLLVKSRGYTHYYSLEDRKVRQGETGGDFVGYVFGFVALMGFFFYGLDYVK